MTLIDFLIVYIISMMQAGFLMANTCVHKQQIYFEKYF